MMERIKGYLIVDSSMLLRLSLNPGVDQGYDGRVG